MSLHHTHKLALQAKHESLYTAYIQFPIGRGQETVAIAFNAMRISQLKDANALPVTLEVGDVFQRKNEKQCYIVLRFAQYHVKSQNWRTCP